METQSANIINFHETRDFGKKVTVTFEFIRQNFKGLVTSILIIAGPPILLASLLMGTFMQDFFSAALSVSQRGGDDAFFASFSTPGFWLQLMLMFVFSIVSAVASLATINCYLMLYEQKQSTQITVAEVWTMVRSTFMMYLGTAVLFTILAIAAYVVLMIPMVLLAAASAALSVIFVMAFFVLLFYVFVSTSLVFIVRAYEKIGFMDALVRSHKLVQGKWWSTFGLLLVLYFIATVISYIFMIPWYITFVISSLHNAGVEGFESGSSAWGITSTVLLSVYQVAHILLYALPVLGIAFQYFNLVERKEARGLMSQIQTIGDPGASSQAPTDEHY